VASTLTSNVRKSPSITSVSRSLVAARGHAGITHDNASLVEA
jgi:hypothetical protein